MSKSITHPDDDTKLVCPECERVSGVYRRNHKYDRYDDDFACHECGATFDVLKEKKTDNRPDPPADPTDDDGLPNNMNPEIKHIVKELRGDI